MKNEGLMETKVGMWGEVWMLKFLCQFQGHQVKLENCVNPRTTLFREPRSCLHQVHKMLCYAIIALYRYMHGPVAPLVLLFKGAHSM